MLPTRSRTAAPLPSADIDDRAVETEVVAGDDSDRRHVGEGGHGVVDDLRELGFVPEIFECFFPAHLWKDRLAGLDRLNQQTPMFPVLRRTDYARPPVHREPCVRAQGVSECVQVIAAVATLAEYATADQRPHQSPEGIGVRADAVCQIIQAQWTFREGVGDAQFGGHLDGLRYKCSVNQLEHHRHRGGRPLMKSIEMVTKTLDDAGHFGGWNLEIFWHHVSLTFTNEPPSHRRHALMFGNVQFPLVIAQCSPAAASRQRVPRSPGQLSRRSQN